MWFGGLSRLGVFDFVICLFVLAWMLFLLSMNLFVVWFGDLCFILCFTILFGDLGCLRFVGLFGVGLLFVNCV